jgi:hypothetical protein
MLPLPIRMALPAAAAILLVAACQESHHDCEVNGVLVGSDVDGCPDPVEDGGHPDDGPDGSALEWGRKPPDRPAESDPPGEHVGPFVFALHDVVLNQQGGAWREIGYDLDGYDTVSNASAVTHGHECVPPREHNRQPDYGWAEAHPPNVPLDGEQGIDNVFGGQLFPFVESTLQVLSSTDEPNLPFDDPDVTFEGLVRDNHQAGRGTWLLVLHDWNGQPNDRAVTAAFARAAAGTPCADVDEVTYDTESHQLVMASDGTTPASPPAWDGNDCYWIHEDDVVITGESFAYWVDNAYVADGTFVMPLGDLWPGLDLSAGPVAMSMRLLGAVLTARIEGIGSASPRLEDITIAGRWSLTNLGQTARHLGICPHSGEQLILTQLLDRQADLRANPDDPHFLDQPCNAISLGLLFEGGTLASLAGGDDLADSAVQGEPLPDLCN